MTYTATNSKTSTLSTERWFTYQFTCEQKCVLIITSINAIHCMVLYSYSEQQNSKVSRYYTLFGFPIVAYVPADSTYRTLYTAIVTTMR